MGLFRKTERERETSPSVATWEQGIDLVRFERLIEAGIRLREKGVAYEEVERRAAADGVSWNEALEAIDRELAEAS